MDGLYLVTIEALPNPGTEDFDECGGAYVNAYIRESSEASALESAQRVITEAGWSCKAVESVAYVTREDFVEEDEGLESFEQALAEGVVLVFHTYPVGPDDEDVVH
jgi:hypothetical protein